MQETLIKETIRKEKHNKGITLIALVVTIIILLILAGVTIMTLLGDNGIINKTSGAKQLTEQKGVEEQILLAVAASMANDKAVVQESLLRTALENSFGTEASGGYTLTGSDSAGWTIVAKGVTYKVDSHGNEIKEPEPPATVTISDLSSNSELLDGNGLMKNTTEVTEVLPQNSSEEPKTFYVPQGFKVMTGEGYSTVINEGIVVADGYGNQFVWVPVPVTIWDGSTQISGTYTPMATTYSYEDSSLKGDTSYSTLYRGILYEFSGTEAKSHKDDYNVGTISCREPSLVTGDSNVKWAPMAIEQGQTDVAGSSYDRANFANAGSFATASAFGTQMQKDYNEMITSVNKYGGFYVGRFETGYETVNNVKIPTSKPAINGVTTADSTTNKGNTWYGLYKMQKEFSTSGKVRSSMIWGSQYDAMMNWMAKTGKTVGDANSSIYNTKQTTGSEKEDILNNVFDLYGCHYEWTLEAFYTSNRAVRGGYYDNSCAPARRSNSDPTGSYNKYGSRLTLYIVE